MQPWGFFKSKAQLAQAEQELRQMYECGSDKLIYDCLREVPVADLFQDNNIFGHAWHPIPDGDFLPADIIETGCYDLSKR